MMNVSGNNPFSSGGNPGFLFSFLDIKGIIMDLDERKQGLFEGRIFMSDPCEADVLIGM